MCAKAVVADAWSHSKRRNNHNTNAQFTAVQTHSQIAITTFSRWANPFGLSLQQFTRADIARVIKMAMCCPAVPDN